MENGVSVTLGEASTGMHAASPISSVCSHEDVAAPLIRRPKEAGLTLKIGKSKGGISKKKARHALALPGPLCGVFEVSEAGTVKLKAAAYTGMNIKSAGLYHLSKELIQENTGEHRMTIADLERGIRVRSVRMLEFVKSPGGQSAIVSEEDYDSLRVFLKAQAEREYAAHSFA